MFNIMSSPHQIVLEPNSASCSISNVFHELQVGTAMHPSFSRGGSETDHHVTISTSSVLGSNISSLISPSGSGGRLNLGLVASVSSSSIAAVATPTSHVAMQLQAFQQQQVPHHEIVYTSANLNVGSSVMGGIGGTQQSQRLKVEDALSYLDQVKVRFTGQNEIYSQFLDIMKEFKSQSIDTQEVIHRVRTLFRGHSDLILGFNTFLPAGYRMEVNPANQTISLHQPDRPPISFPANIGTLTGAVLHTTIQQQTSLSSTTMAPVSTGTVSSLTLRPTTLASLGQVVSGVTISGVVSCTVANVNSSTLGASGFGNTVQGTSVASVPSRLVPPAFHARPSSINMEPICAPQTSQVFEFNHAISYVNKIKNRFQNQPEIYKQFLEILHKYQKEQRMIKDGSNVSHPLSEAQVYDEVERLFMGQKDLLEEFSAFLPDATEASFVVRERDFERKKPSGALLSGHGGVGTSHSVMPSHVGGSGSVAGAISSTSNNATSCVRSAGLIASGQSSAVVKRARSSLVDEVPIKKSRTVSGSGNGLLITASNTSLPLIKEISLADSCKHGTLKDYNLFDKIRKVIKYQDIYENFLRCIYLFNNDIVTRAELVKLINPFLSRYPELFRAFKETLGQSDASYSDGAAVGGSRVKERLHGDIGLEVDFSTCRKMGASYRQLPRSYVPLQCSGRTALCREVLNDTYVSLPYSSEDSQTVSSKKNQYEEFVYRTEDERYELDMVLELNALMIRCLETVSKKLQRMTQEDAAKYRLNEELGGSSPVLARKAIQRIYGEKAGDIIQGLLRNPAVAVPLVLRRLKSKETEWREAQRGFNRIWRDQNEKYYLKSLDHQSVNFKQTDAKNLRRNAILQNIEALADERLEKGSTGPHVCLFYPSLEDDRRVILADAVSLLIHHVKRQATISQNEKTLIKRLLRQTLHDFFLQPRMPLSDDDDDDASGDGVIKNEVKDEAEECVNVENEIDKTIRTGPHPPPPEPLSEAIKLQLQQQSFDHAVADEVESSSNEEHSILFFADKYWYVFLRLHQILCHRLHMLRFMAQRLAIDEDAQCEQRNKSTAVALRLRQPLNLFPSDYYNHTLDMIRALLDGNLDALTYEDQLRELLGVHVYPAFTLDKVVQNAVRQLQYLVTEELSVKMTRFWSSEQAARRTFAGVVRAGDAEETYRRCAEKALVDEHCFRVEIFPSNGRLNIELIDTSSSSVSAELGLNSATSSRVCTWQSYMDCFSANSDTIHDPRFLGRLRIAVKERPVFLLRNVVRWIALSRQRRHSSASVRSEDNCKPLLNATSTESCVIKSEAVEVDDIVEEDVTMEEEIVEEEVEIPCMVECFKSGSSIGKLKEVDCAAALLMNSKDEVWQRNTREHLLNMFNYNISHAHLFDKLTHWDNTEISFKANSIKMMYKAGFESYFYRSRQLTRARAVHRRLVEVRWQRWSHWLATWRYHHISALQESACLDWLEGRNQSDLVSDLLTTRVELGRERCASPYRLYCKYRVHRRVD